MSAVERIPAARYTDPAYAAREWDRMWTRVWLLAAHASELPDDGDFVVFEVGAESVIVARDGGRVRAFYNVCQHRGNVLCARASGNARSFRCGYHHWEWGLDGALRAAPRALPRVTDEARGAFALAPVACEERLGFVWVCLAREPEESVDAYLAPVASRVEAYRPAQGWALAADQTIEIACNWKASVDVSNEAYHLRTLHPDLLQVVDDDAVAYEQLGIHSQHAVPLGVPARASPWRGAVTDPVRALLREVGEDPDALAGRADAVPAALARGARARAARDGVDVSALTDAHLAGRYQFYVFPNVQLNYTPWKLELFRHRPHATDPCVTLFDERAFVRVAAGAAAPQRPAHRRFRHGERPLGETMGQDVDLLPRLQQGMRSRGFRGAYATEREASIAGMHRALERYVGAEDAPPP